MYLDSIQGIAGGEPPLSAEAFVMLDPAVELLDVGMDGLGDAQLLCHGYFATGMAVPPGEGLVDFLSGLVAAPVRVADLHAAFSDRQLVDRMLASLLGAGFLHLTGPSVPLPEAWASLRYDATLKHRAQLQPRVEIDLDAHEPVDGLAARLNKGVRPADVVLRCARLADHRAVLAQLAQLRMSGAVRLYDCALRTADPACDADICRSLRQLGCAVIVEGVDWPAPSGAIAGLEELTRHCIALRAQMQVVDLTILDPCMRDRVAGWMRAGSISGLRLRLDADALPGTEQDFAAIFAALDALGDICGDVVVENLPSDEQLLGLAEGAMESEPLSDRAARFRRAYLRHRLPFLKACEGENSWSQTPEAEEKLVRAQDDLLPNQPALLRLQPGSVLVDVCGGLGRVARRLSPLVGEDGLIVSIEMLHFLSARARNFACEQGLTNLSFRPGLAQRIPLPDGVADAAVNEWTGAIWELGLGPAMIGEMVRVVRPGGRIAVTHRLVRLPLTRLGQPWVQYDEIYGWIRAALERPGLDIVVERIWGQIAPSLIGENASKCRKQYVPGIINPFDFFPRSHLFRPVEQSAE